MLNLNQSMRIKERMFNSQLKMQTAGCCFHHANENSPQSAFYPTLNIYFVKQNSWSTCITGSLL